MHTRAPATPATAAAGVALLVLAGCAGPPGDDDPATLTIGTMTVPQSLDPADAMGSAAPYFQAVYDSLVRREPDGTYAPMLATEWSYDDTLTELELTLREDVAFDDGTPFDAEAVKANLERFPEAGGGQAHTLEGLEGVEVADEFRAVVHLSQPNRALLYYLSDAAGFMANPGSLGDGLATAPDGTGPYELDPGRTAIGTTWVFERKDEYWGEPLPYEEVAISAFDRENALVNGVRTGQINAAVVQEADQQSVVRSEPGLESVPQDIDYQGLILFDRDGHLVPELADRRVRQAVNHALDRPTMLDKLVDGQGELTDQVFGTETAAYEPELDSRYEHDPERARELLAEAGHPDGFDLTLPRMPEIVGEPMATSISTDLAEVGIDLEWDELDPANALRAVFTDQAYPAMVMNNAQPAEDWVTVAELVLPGTFNFLGTTDDTVGELVREIQNAPADEAAEPARELNRHLVEEAWFVPFYRLTYQHVSDGNVEIEPQSGAAAPSLYNYTPAG
ncbi:ABC transporter substrate-binding protein [Nocardiopsis sp. HNM0947]|uniref:ABC transporter substrate-binding protein n=1 Tax=Nocardiopsis coralli TaxID=2772213 RepID=A0ABR9PAL7_9ACTN|nr:ABC transporter substrate-binding protein [Nocardiopsis coralli]MBE3000877.1 ABC transporter substrate-binding protein [Nocardiopsis coralli]